MPSPEIASVVAAIERAIDEARFVGRRSHRIEDVIHLAWQMRFTQQVLLRTMEWKVSMNME